MQGKRYQLGKQHGPWMILVASFHTTAPDGKTVKGKTPEQAADELIYELRKSGIPAYVFQRTPENEVISTVDRAGRDDRRKNLRRVASTCVIAGNYPSIDDETAQKTLAWIKKFRPKSLEDGVVYQPTPGRPGPLSGAFLTINPLLSAEEVAQRRRDPLLAQLNSGVRHSLLEADGEFTLVIATFTGKSVTQVGKGQSISLDSFLKDNDLDDAAMQAQQLAIALRDNEGVDAYVWHDRFKSVVTAGAFRSQNDPRIRTLYEKFAAKPELVGQQQAPSMKVQFLAIDGRGRKLDPEKVNPAQLDSRVKLWAFDPNPQLMRIPKWR